MNVTQHHIVNVLCRIEASRPEAIRCIRVVNRWLAITYMRLHGGHVFRDVPLDPQIEDEIRC